MPINDVRMTDSLLETSEKAASYVRAEVTPRETAFTVEFS